MRPAHHLPGRAGRARRLSLRAGPRPVDVHDDATVEAPGLDEVEAQRHGQRAEQRLPAADRRRLDDQAVLIDQGPDGRLDWAPAAEPDPGQRRLLQRFIAAHEQADPEAPTAMVRDDIRLAISPQVGEWNGRRQVGDALRDGMTSLEHGGLAEMAAFEQPSTFTAFGLPDSAT